MASQGKQLGGHAHWAAAWTASIQGPYPHGNPTGQPDMSRALPAAERGAVDQSFRLMVRPDVWGSQARLRFSNVLGNRLLRLAGVHAGLQLMSSALLPGSNRPITFGGSEEVAIEAGSDVWSDPVQLAVSGHLDNPLFTGKRLAVSFHVVGESGPMTWHAKAMATSYMGAPGSGPHGANESESAFIYPTASWFFLDAVEMLMPQPTRVVVCFGDSISDGSGSTINGDDRWPDVLSRRLHAVHGNRVSVVNTGIGGNKILEPARYDTAQPTAGGPSALSRIERDVAALAGVSTVIWLEGINDFSQGNVTSAQLQQGFRTGIERLRSAIPGVRIVLCTLTTALGATTPGHGTAEVDRQRRLLNDFIRTTPLADGFIDFDRVTCEAGTGRLRPEMIPGSSVGGPGDGLHPNRIGYQAMGAAIDLNTVLG